MTTPMRKLIAVALIVAVLDVALGCSSATAPKAAPKAPSRLETCRSGWTITAGDQPDSTYTGCTE